MQAVQKAVPFEFVLKKINEAVSKANTSSVQYV
jgi:hypothetical protein